MSIFERLIRLKSRQLNVSEMNDDARNRIHVAPQRTANASVAEVEDVYSGCCRQSTGNRTLCADRTHSPRGVGDGASAVALAATEKRSRPSRVRRFFLFHKWGTDAAIGDLEERPRGERIC